MSVLCKILVALSIGVQYCRAGSSSGTWVYYQTASINAKENCGDGNSLPACAPEYWGQANVADNVCGTGRVQSPIDISYSTTSTTLEPLEFGYNGTCSSQTLGGLPNTWKLDIDCGYAYFITWLGKRYYLKQFHFHAPSEYNIKGISYDCEVHLVHVSNDGKLLVVGVNMDASPLYPDNPFLDRFWVLPKTDTNGAADDFVGHEPNLELVSFDPYSSMLPQVRSYYNFAGSLTTPPCSEGVTWIEMANIITMSAAQLNTMKTSLANLEKTQVSTTTAQFGNNNRPLQASNNRQILYYEDPATPKTTTTTDKASDSTIFKESFFVVFLKCTVVFICVLNSIF
jgi:carbonic anhydrase